MTNGCASDIKYDNNLNIAGRGIEMENAFIGAAFAAAGGVLIAFVTDWISRAALARNPATLPSFFIVRQILNIAYLAALYFLARVLPWGVLPLLIGGALGITVPSFFFARRLVRLNDARHSESRPEDKGGEA